MDPHAIASINAIFGPPIVIPGIAPAKDNGQILTPNRQSTYNYSGRIDQHIGDRDFIFFRYAGWQETNIGASSIPHLLSQGEIERFVDGEGPEQRCVQLVVGLVHQDVASVVAQRSLSGSDKGGGVKPLVLVAVCQVRVSDNIRRS